MILECLDDRFRVLAIFLRDVSVCYPFEGVIRQSCCEFCDAPFFALVLICDEMDAVYPDVHGPPLFPLLESGLISFQVENWKLDVRCARGLILDERERLNLISQELESISVAGLHGCNYFLVLLLDSFLTGFVGFS